MNDRDDDTLSRDQLASRSSYGSESLLLLPFVIVKDAVSWVRDAIKQRGLPD